MNLTHFSLFSGRGNLIIQLALGIKKLICIMEFLVSLLLAPLLWEDREPRPLFMHLILNVVPNARNNFLSVQKVGIKMAKLRIKHTGLFFKSSDLRNRQIIWT